MSDDTYEVSIQNHIKNHVSLLAAHHETDTGSLNASLEDFLDHLESIGLVAQSSVYWDVKGEDDEWDYRFNIYVRLPGETKYTTIEVVATKTGIPFDEIAA